MHCRKNNKFWSFYTFFYLINYVWIGFYPTLIMAAPTPAEALQTSVKNTPYKIENGHLVLLDNSSKMKEMNNKGQWFGATAISKYEMPRLNEEVR